MRSFKRINFAKNLPGGKIIKKDVSAIKIKGGEAKTYLEAVKCK